MNNSIRQKLLDLVARHGRELTNDPRRCESLMRDHFPADRREIAVLTIACENRIPADLLAVKPVPGRTALFARLARRLHDDVAMDEAAARWAVHTWAFALGVLPPAELAALEQGGAGTPHDPATRTTHATGVAPTGSSISTTRAKQPPAAVVAATTNATASPIGAQASLVIAADGSGDFLTIRDAIRRAATGARLVVRPGIYHEGFVIDKQLEIIGDGDLDEIIVRATDSSVLVMQTDSAIVRNLTLRGQARVGGANDEGFFAVDIPHGRLVLEACDISSDSLACVAIHNPAAAPVIRRCNIHHGVDAGVFAFDGAGGEIVDCDIFENRNIGVAVTSRARTLLSGCHIHHGGDAGIVVWDDAETTIDDCEIDSNSKTNIGVSDRARAVVRRSRIHGGNNTGVFVHREGSASLEECNIRQHAEAEVAVTTGGDVRLQSCQLHNGQAHGVFVRDAGRASVERCDVFRNRVSGIHVDANGVLVARACRINENGRVGIACEAHGAVSVEGCDLSGNRIAAWQTDHGSHVESRNNRL